MFYIKELHIEEYFLLDNPVHLTFAPYVNYLTGKNGSGKSSLLEFILKVCGLRFEDIEDNGQPLKFSAEFGNTEDDDFRCSLQYERSVEKIDIANILGDMGSIHQIRDAYTEQTDLFSLMMKNNADKIDIISDKENELRYDINGDIFVSKSRSDALSTAIFLGLTKNPKYERYASFWSGTPFSRFINWSSAFRFTEGLHQEESKFLTSKNFVTLTEKDNGSHFSSLVGGLLLVEKSVFLKKLESVYNEDSEYLPFSSDESDILRAIRDELSLRDIRLNYHIDSNKQEYNKQKFEMSLNTITITLNSGEKIPYKKLSYGERRYMMAKLHWFQNRDLRCFDEPVNGLHYNLIENFMGWVNESECQVFIANQNPVLFDFIHFKDDTSFGSQMTFCKRVDNEMIWVKPTSQQVRQFMSDYRKQFLNVSTIMKFQELW